MQTARLVLRQPQPEDADALYALRSDPGVMRYFGRPLMKDREEARQFLELVNANFVNNEGLQWTICLSGDPRLIGTITIWKIDKVNHRAEIGYLLDPEYQGQGIMTEALKALIRHAFETLRLHSLEANVNPENEASINLLERNGFVREAYFRENFYFDGKFEDSAIYSLLSSV